MAVDGLGDVGGFVAHCVADVLDLYAVAAHDRDGRVPTFVGMPAADSSAASYRVEAPIELVGRVGVAVLVTEDEVVVVPGFAVIAEYERLATARIQAELGHR